MSDKLKADWSVHHKWTQPYRTQPLLWEQFDTMAIVVTHDELEESIEQMEEFTEAISMLQNIGIDI